MVAVVHAKPGSAAPQAVAAWLDSLEGIYPREDIDGFRAAFDYMQQRADAQPGADGEKLVDRALATAGIEGIVAIRQLLVEGLVRGLDGHVLLLGNAGRA